MSAAAEYRAERADDIFRRYVDKLIHAQTSCGMSDWYEVGKAWEAFSNAAASAEIDPRARPFLHASEVMPNA